MSLASGSTIWRQSPRSLELYSRSEDAGGGEFNAVYYLDNMMSCTTNRTFIETLIDFANYGCYCGPSGWGEPVDEVDRCCKAHDECYGATHSSERGECILNIMAYLIPYHFTLHKCDTPDAYITCAGIEAYNWYDLLPECSIAICNCDRVIAECIAKYTYHEKYRFYNRLKCFSNDDADNKTPNEMDQEAANDQENEIA